MKKDFHSIAVATTIATTMLMQIFVPSIAFALDTTEVSEPDVAVETTVETDESETETSSVVITESTETTSVEYVEETEDLIATETTESTSDEEETISSATNTDPTEESEESEESVETEATIETSETEETIETEELEEIEYVVFDHYYTDIDASLVSTSDLLVITSDSSIFTRNTNVVSNYDNAYIIECESVEEARFVYSYYVDKADFITDLSAVVSVASPENTEDIDETVPVEPEVINETEVTETETTTEETTETLVTNETEEPVVNENTETVEEQEPDVADLSDLNNGNDAIANLNDIDTIHNDYAGYIALIDTGANVQANFTVLSGDTFDHNGHGTAMVRNIRSENPLAQIISIKVSEDGTATAADIYAGFRLAIDLNVSVINFSMTAPNIEKNAVIRDIIQEALDAGIVVIGAAGNNAINSSHFIPGCIEGVITVGAATMGGVRNPSSNYGADYYAIADSSSEATARFTGMYTADLVENAMFFNLLFDYLCENEYDWAYEVADGMTDAAQADGYDIYYSVAINDDGTVSYITNDFNSGEFGTAYEPQVSADWATEEYSGATIADGIYSGTCSFNRKGQGWGYAYGFSDQTFNSFATAINRNTAESGIHVACGFVFGDRDEEWARDLNASSVYFRAEVTGGEVTLYISDRSDVSPVSSTWVAVTEIVNVQGSFYPQYGEYSITSIVNVTTGQTIWTGRQTFSSVSDLNAFVSSKLSGHFSGKKPWSVDGHGIGNYTFRYYDGGSQRYQGKLIGGGQPVSGRVRIQKVGDDGVTGLPGATITLTGPLDSSTFRIVNATSPSRVGNTLTFTTTTRATEIEGLLPNTVYTFTETHAPDNYQIATPDSIRFSTDANGVISASSSGQWNWRSNTATFTLTNTSGAAGEVSFRKVGQDNTNDEGTGTTQKLANATIEFRSASGISLADATVTMGVGSGLERADNYIRFVTGAGNGYDITIGNLAPGTYYFTEIVTPMGYETAPDCYITVNADGICTPGTVTMVDSEKYAEWGSIGIIKNWTGSLSDTYQFWQSVENISFDLYGGNWNIDEVREWRDGGNMRSASAFANGHLEQSGITANERSALVYWDFLKSNTGAYLGPAGFGPGGASYYQYLSPVSGHYEFWGEGAADCVNYLPRGHYSVITETWEEGMFWEGDQAVYIHTLNASGWHDIDSDPNDGEHKYAAIYFIDNNGITWICNWNTLQPETPLTVTEGPYGEYWIDDFYVDNVYNDSNYGSLDVLKIDETGLGVDGVRFELHADRTGYPLIGTGTISGSAGVTTDGYNTYNVSWDYTVLGRGDFSYWHLDNGFDDDEGSRVGGFHAASHIGGPADQRDSRGFEYNIAGYEAWSRDGGYDMGDVYPVRNDQYIPTPDSLLALERYYRAHPNEFSNDPTSAQDWRDGKPMVPFEFWSPGLYIEGQHYEGHFNINNGNLNEVYLTNRDVMNYLNYGSYYIYEYIEDSNGNNILSTYDTPVGWTRSADGTYFYKRVDVTPAYHTTTLTVNIANNIVGRIDVSKVNLTGGPLSDLATRGIFEVRRTINSDGVRETTPVLLAQGHIPTNATPENDNTYSAVWRYRINGSWTASDNNNIAIVGLGTFEIREYIPASAVDDPTDMTVGGGGWSGPYTSNDGQWYYFTKTITITSANGTVTQNITAVNEVHPEIHTTLTDMSGAHVTVVGEDITFTDVVTYERAYANATYIMNATLVDADTGEVIQTADGVRFTTTSGHGTVNVSFTVNTAELVRATESPVSGIISYEPRSVVCFESMTLVDGTEIAFHRDIADEAQTVDIPNPELETTLTSVQNVRSHAAVGETVEFIDTVSYSNLHVGEEYTITAYIYDQDSGQRLVGPDGRAYSGTVTFEAEASEGTIDVPITINTANIINAYIDDQGVIHEQTKNIVCYEYLYSENDILIGGHTELNDEGQTVEIQPPEIGTVFTDLQTQEHETVSGRIVEVRDEVSYTNLHVGETYTLTCRLYDQTTGNALEYSNGDLVIATKTFVAQEASGTVYVDFTIDTSDLLVNVFDYEERTIIAFEYLRTENDILIAGHTDISDMDQGNIGRLPILHTTIVDDQTGTREGRLGATVPFTDTVSYTNLNVGETYEIRGRIVSRENPNIVYATATQEFIPESRTGTVDVHFTVDTSLVCDGSYEAYIVCFEQLWQLDTQNTGRGEVLLATHEDVTDQGQTIHLQPEIQTQMTDPVTHSEYGIIGESVRLVDTVSYHNLHINETYTVYGTIMDQQTGEPVLDENGNAITAHTTFIPESSDGTVEVVYILNTLRLIQQIGQTINGVTIEAPRQIVSFERIESSTGYNFEIHADINDTAQTIILGDIRSGAGDTQTSTSWLAAGMTTVHDNVHYRGLGPVEYTLRGSLHLIDYDENGNPIDGGFIEARPGEITELEYTWTPSNHEGDVGFDFRIDSNRFQGKNIIVFEELWYNGVCIISHENYSDTLGNFGMANTEQTVHVASVWTSAFSFQSGEQLLAYDEHTTVTDFVYYGNVEIGQDYYCEASLWACYTDENGYIHQTPIAQEDGGIATSPVFRATENHGIAEVTFTIDSTKLFDQHYDYLLVTERLIHVGSGVCIATHSDLTSKEQSIYIPELHTTATDGATGGKVLTETATATIVDRVYYENLIPGTEYTIVGNVQYAKTDANGNVTESGGLVQNGVAVTASHTFVPTSSSGYVDLTFTVNALEIDSSVSKLVVFEDIYTGPGIRVGTHADITDESQTIYLNGKIHIQVAKVDADNINYFLQGAEITIFNSDGTIATDVNGNPCVGVTNADGLVDFIVNYDPNNTYYAMETAAPEGYDINTNKFYVEVSVADRDAGIMLIPITITDVALNIPPRTSIPPRTGDNLALYAIITVLAVCGIAGGAFFITKKKDSES